MRKRTPRRTPRGITWGRRILLAATLAVMSALLVAGPASAKYIWLAS
jgi:hypothetical protein